MRLLVLFFALACPVVAGTLELPALDGVVRLAGTGDVMVHQCVKAAARAHAKDDTEAPASGWNALFEDVADVLNVADVAFANLETPLVPAPTADPWFLQSGAFPLYKAPCELAAALRWASFHVVSVANNHAMDQGVAGVASTVDAVRAAGLVPLGGGKTREEAEQPEVRVVHGVRVGFLGATAFLNQPVEFKRDEPQVALLNEGALPAFCRRVRELKSRVDLVVVSVHWGEEEMDEPRERERSWAHALCEAGADVIFGHHPHVLQPIELYAAKDGHRAVIAYSLGNFMTGNPDAAWRTGAIVIVEAARDAAGAVRVSGYGHVATWCTTERVTNTERMIRNARLVAEDPTASPARREAARADQASYERRLEDVRKALGPGWVSVDASGHDKKERVVETPAPPRP